MIASCHTPGVAVERIHGEKVVVGDAWGELIKECWDGRNSGSRSFHIGERSDGFIAASDVTHLYFEPDKDWSAPSLPFAHHVRGRILDVGAGAGRLALELQGLGLDVVALDMSPGAIEVCLARGVKHTFQGTLGDLAAARPEPFDTVIMAGNNLGILGGREQGAELLSSLTAITAPGARILAETTDPYQVPTDYTAYYDDNRRCGRFPAQMQLRDRHRLLVSEWYDYLYCNPEELEELLAPTPWFLEAAHPRGADAKEWGPGLTWVAVLARRDEP